MSFSMHSEDPMTLIDWVNSLDIPSCTLVDHFQDLKSGLVVADILYFLTDTPVKKIQKNLVSKAQILNNWVQVLDHVSSFFPECPISSPESYIEDNYQLIQLLAYLSTSPKPVTQTVFAPQRFPDFESTAKFFPKPKFNESLLKKPPRSPPNPLKNHFSLDTPQKVPEKSKRESKPMSEDQKVTLLKWLEELDVIRKETVSIDLFPTICKIGVLFSDLINRLEGKNEILHGIERNPKNKTQALANYSKILEYLRSLPKMNPRYLWSSKDIIEGNEPAAWGLLEDIKSLYCPKPVSRPSSQTSELAFQNDLPQDIIREKPSRSHSASLKKHSIASPKHSGFFIDEPTKKSVTEWVKALGLELKLDPNPFIDNLKNGVLVCELMRLLTQNSFKFNPNPRSAKSVCKNFESAFAVLKKSHCKSATPDPTSLSTEAIFAFVYSLMSLYPNFLPADYRNLQHSIVEVRKFEKFITDWIVRLNILHPPPQSFQEIIPEFKSGVLLCVVVSRALRLKVPSLVKDPKTEQSCMNNIRKALDLLRSVPNMPQKYLWNEKEVAKGNPGVILGLLRDVFKCAHGVETDFIWVENKMNSFQDKNRSFNEESFNTTFGSMQSPASRMLLNPQYSNKNNLPKMPRSVY